MKEAANRGGLWESEVFDDGLGDLCRIANAVQSKLDNFFGDDLGERVVAVNQMQVAQRALISQVQAPDLLRPQCICEQSIDRHERPHPQFQGSSNTQFYESAAAASARLPTLANN